MTIQCLSQHVTLHIAEGASGTRVTANAGKDISSSGSDAEDAAATLSKSPRILKPIATFFVCFHPVTTSWKWLFTAFTGPPSSAAP